MNKNPESRIGLKQIKESNWFKYFYETDSSNEDQNVNILNYDFKNEKIFKIFKLIKNNNFTVKFFLKIYEEIFYIEGNKDCSNNRLKLKEITKENEINYNFVESEIVSLDNSTQSFKKFNPKNCIKLDENKQKIILSEIKKHKINNQNFSGIFDLLNNLVDICKSLFHISNEFQKIESSTISKFYKKKQFNEDFKLNKEEKIILQIFEEMESFGFKIEEIENSLCNKKLNSIRGTFRLLATKLISDKK